MASRPNTRGLTVTSRPATRGLATRTQGIKAVQGVKIHNENSIRPPVLGKPSSSFLRDTTNKVLGLKRKAEGALEEQKITKKRSAFGDLTNAIEKKINDGKKVAAQKGRLVRNGSTVSLRKVAKPSIKNPVQSLSMKITVPELLTIKVEEAKEVSFCDTLPSSQDTIYSQETNKTDLDDSAGYVTASEESPVITRSPVKQVVDDKPQLPEGVADYDKEMESDPFAMALYARDIFNYYKERENKFPIDKYIDRQPDVSRSMRSILVDWMVEVQESFELNHETLYLAVKLVDLYLAKVVIKRDVLQLIGSTAMFIACKFDERTPPYVDDFLYICDDAYKRKELLSMEIKILKVIGFDLGIPLSYRFLRRYARCAKVNMEDLTFTRYILEMGLMDYELIDSSDSALAAAALFLSRIIKGEPTWTPTLQYYSGYTMEDLYHLVHLLHNMISQPPKEHLKTIRNKYSHKVFYEVAKIPIPEKIVF
ncbi:G2/mitotic-specific cyclin-B3 isoform X2 [Procambarus clarkii]|uniref:G2/mitotic-specific cyclin-B3 isoform X2 n=1 Tax=Procambarus clarkii TaxID=6728 RepID=UPI001E673328|nr:G2/mitotic-specific cyclin-B3-like isoform X2 [Procambarus clarkii]